MVVREEEEVEGKKKKRKKRSSLREQNQKLNLLGLDVNKRRQHLSVSAQEHRAARLLSPKDLGVQFTQFASHLLPPVSLVTEELAIG